MTSTTDIGGTENTVAAVPGAGMRVPVFDVGLEGRLPFGQLLALGFQNIFGMIGMFIFPGILGQAVHLPVEQIAYLYGMTFVVSGLVTAAQALLVLRLPIVHGPYVGSFTALLTLGVMRDSGLAVAFGSAFVACIIWFLLTIPIRGWSFCGLFVRYMQSPMISGIMVLLTMVQLATASVPGWIGERQSPGYPLVNFLCGAVAIAVLMAVTLNGGKRLRRVAMLIGAGVGTLCYAAVVPISFTKVVQAPWIVTPQLFPFGFAVRPDVVVVFLLVLVPASIGSMVLYQLVGGWTHQRLTPARMSGGLMSAALGGVLASLLGTFSTFVYPDNIALLRSTRVASRFAVLAAGLLLVVLGACVKFDMLLVLVPSPILSALATILFGIVMVHAIHHLAPVEWDETNLIIAGFALLLGIGGLFVAGDTLQGLPLIVRLLLRQAVVTGGIPLIVLHALLVRGRSQSPPPLRGEVENA
jgi:xanthine/uracil permease